MKNTAFPAYDHIPNCSIRLEVLLVFFMKIIGGMEGKIPAKWQ